MSVITVRRQREARAIPAHRQCDPAGIREAILTSIWPAAKSSYGEVKERIERNYGSVNDRTLARHMAKLKAEGVLSEDNRRLK